ncbi:hypothetical protein Ocin01_01246 [Orchesella cincta]|uniref:Uncharacterized protein n=1 Tax=Orchesella cincta TaxID=48709 RepID=A0A1D2NJK5_ORCCI|nr:hypothetical protein Ocin01_01246 [Orchesella cincta]
MGEMDDSSYCWIDQFPDGIEECLACLFDDPPGSYDSEDSGHEFEAESDLTALFEETWMNLDWGSDIEFNSMPNMVGSSYNWQMDPNASGSFENLIVDTDTINPLQTLLCADANYQIPQAVTYEPANANDVALTPDPVTWTENIPSPVFAIAEKSPKKKKAEKTIPLYARNSEDPDLTKKERNNIKKAQRSKAFHDRRVLRLTTARETFKSSLKEREKEFEELLATVAAMTLKGQEISPEIHQGINYVKESLDDARKIRSHYKLDGKHLMFYPKL